MSSSQSPASAAPALPDFGPIVSSQLIGSLLTFFFFGTLVVQVYVYRLCFPKDQRGIKALVYFIFLALTVCTCLNAADVQYWFGSGFGNIARFAEPRYGPVYTPIMGSFIGMLVQLFFCYRIFVIKRAAWPLSIAIGLISMAQCAGGMGGGIISLIDENSVHDQARTILVYLWLAGGAAADVLIAGSMTYLPLTPPQLLRAAVFRSTRDALKDVVRLIIETNTFSTTIAVLGLVLFVAVPNTTYFICPTMILPGIYANTLLVTLNNRAIVRLQDSPVQGSATMVQSRPSAAGSVPGKMSFAAPPPQKETANHWREQMEDESEGERV
ncbi:hypothetical protein DFH09DRAFT_1082361 [Mycena vulgaris]|nr:hypothetical protein DFH09DRAFT_1082361 [Mycena vulgaris]